MLMLPKYREVESVAVWENHPCGWDSLDDDDTNADVNDVDDGDGDDDDDSSKEVQSVAAWEPPTRQLITRNLLPHILHTPSSNTIPHCQTLPNG